MSHKRNGKAAKARRQAVVAHRKKALTQFSKHLEGMSDDERLITAIFGAYEDCDECGNSKLVRTDCMTPHCIALREEVSEFYDEVTENHIKIGGATMQSGVDY